MSTEPTYNDDRVPTPEELVTAIHNVREAQHYLEKCYPQWTANGKSHAVEMATGSLQRAHNALAVLMKNFNKNVLLRT